MKEHGTWHVQTIAASKFVVENWQIAGGADQFRKRGLPVVRK